jgi:DNA mismatch repair ATPase MutS
MLVEERIVDDRPRLEFKYKIQSGPSTVQNYGLALARCLRFPSTLLDRAEEISSQILDETMMDLTTTRKNLRTVDDSEAMEVDESNVTANVSQEMAVLDRDVIDLYSTILLMINSEEKEIDIVNQKLQNLIDKMSLEFKELIKNSSVEQIIGILNSTVRTLDG